MAQNRVVKSLETADLDEEESKGRVWMGDWPTMDSAKVEGKATMGLKEIMVESARLIKLKVRELAPFVLILSSVVAIVFCLGIVELHAAIACFRRYGFYDRVENLKQITLIGTTLGLLCFHLLAVCTTLLVAAPFQTHSHDDATEVTFDPGYIFNTTRKLYVTSVMGALFICVVMSICVALTVVGLPRMVAKLGTVMTALVTVGAVGFSFWVVMFVVDTTLTTAVVVLERRWGVPAMMRSTKLVGRKRKTAVGVVFLNVMAGTAICTVVVASTTGPVWVQLVGFVFGVASTMAYWVSFITVRTVLYVCCAAHKVELCLLVG